MTFSYDATKNYFLLIAVAAMAACASPVSDLRVNTESQMPREKSGQAVQEARERTLRGLIDELNSIMQPPYDDKPGSEVRAVYLIVKEQMARGGLAFTIIDDGEKKVQAAFVPAQKGTKSLIEVNGALIDIANSRPTLAMSMLMHEMKHARDYFTVGETYKEHMKNSLEEFMYEMDALFIEALFIRDYLAPRYKDLTAFEQYVLASLENDNLASVALVFMAVDMSLTYRFYGIGKELDSGMSCKDYFAEFSRRGKPLFDLPIPKEDFQKYNSLIAIKTFTTMAAPLVDSAMARNKRCGAGEHKTAINEINNFVKRGNALIREHAKFLDDYVKQIHQHYLVF